MALVALCPGCGKKNRFPDSEAGLVGVCRACGRHFALPKAPPPAPPAHALAEEVTPPADAKRNGPWVIVAAAGVGLALLVGCLAVVVSRPNWETQHRQEILALKSSAEDLAVAGQWDQAYAQYRRIEELVEGQTLRDPSLRTQVEKAMADKNALYAIVLLQSQAGRPVAGKTADVPPAGVLPATRPATRPTAVADAGGTTTPNPPPVISPPVTRPANPPATRPTVAVAPPPVTQPVIQLSLVRRPAVRPVSDAMTDEHIGQSIQKGVDFLLGQFEKGKLKANRSTGTYYTGMNALCVYALLQAGQAIQDERLNPRGATVREMMSALKEMPTEGGPVTYARALRASAFALLNRPEDRAALKLDHIYLMKAVNQGAYTYDDRMNRLNNQFTGRLNLWDNSNSQYGLLGAWSGAEVGMEVPDAYWRQVEKHWIESQTQDGQWAYGAGGNGYLAMTVAGIASLFVTHDYLEAPKVGRDGANVGREPFSPALAKALKWLEQGDNAIDVRQSHWGPGYSLYGLERVGLASGFKYFGTHDWYRELSKTVLKRQRANGSWSRVEQRDPAWGARDAIGENDLVETGYSLLFLSRGRHPIMLNKLRFDGYWANRPRDAANLARFAGRELERPLNFQVVDLSRDWSDWMDCPILYIASHEPPKLTDADYAKLRSFVEAGGMIYTQADGANEAFSTFVRRMATRISPYELTDLPPDHEIYSVVFPIAQPRPALKCVSNGSRLLLVHSPADLALSWQQRADTGKRTLFELGTNIFIYAAGKTNLRNRLSSPYIAPPTESPAGRVRLARLSYGGNWNPEPYAFVRFSHYLQNETGIAVETVVCDLKNLEVTTAPIAHLTGTAGQRWTEAELAAIRRYVEGGGLLIADAAGGAWEFGSQARVAMEQALAGAKRTTVGPSHPLMAGQKEGTEKIERLQMRPYAQTKLGIGAGVVEVYRAGKGAAVFSLMDITTGLLGTRTWGIAGFDPRTCQALLRNAIYWAADGLPEAVR